jgi:hypothetical protein
MNLSVDGLTCHDIHIPSFIKTGPAVQKLIDGKYRHTDSILIAEAYFYFFRTRKERLKIQIIVVFLSCLKG